MKKDKLLSQFNKSILLASPPKRQTLVAPQAHSLIPLDSGMLASIQGGSMVDPPKYIKTN